MSRFYNNCVDEASLTTLCPICLDSFQGAKGVRVWRADPKQKMQKPTMLKKKRRSRLNWTS